MPLVVRLWVAASRGLERVSPSFSGEAAPAVCWGMADDQSGESSGRGFRLFLCAVMGFSSGMPLYVLYQMLPAWLRDSGVDLKSIGLLSAVGVAYNFKFLWAPLLDRYSVLGMGRRRGWGLLTQVGLLIALLAMGTLSPQASLSQIAVLATVIAVLSASQDVVIDGYRRELLSDHELGPGNAMYVSTYRFSSLLPGGLALILADGTLPWSMVWSVVAAGMLFGILGTFAWKEPEHQKPTSGLLTAMIDPLRQLWKRISWKQLGAPLLFMLLYKFGDNLATAPMTPFLMDLGFAKAEIGSVVKVVNLVGAIVGASLGGVIMLRLGLNRSLWIFGVVQLSSILGFVILSEMGARMEVLVPVLAFEYLGVGMGSAALLAYTAKITDRSYAGSQFAIFTSIMTLPRTIVGAQWGFVVEALGYTQYFLICAALAIPGMLMLGVVAPWRDQD